MANTPSTRFRNILVAVDGSESSLRATEVAIEMSKALAATLTIANIVEIPVTPSLPDESVEIDVKQLDSTTSTPGEKMVSAAASLSEARGVQTVKKVITYMGSAGEGVSEYASKNDIDLIVVGTRGRGGLERLVLGSVADGVVHHARCPVLVVR